MNFRPEPPYYAVIIAQTTSGVDAEGYAAMNVRMTELGEQVPGYLGRESMSDSEGRDLTVIYYRDSDAIAAWQADPEHLEAQRLGRERWLASYTVEVARVERAYGHPRA